MSGKHVARAAAVLRVAAQLEADGNGAAASEYRRRKTERDPLLFALVYLSRHLANADGRITLSRVHLAWVKSAKAWRKTPTAPMQGRRAEVAPREMGKSTWWFLILPLWAAAHGHVKFAAAFADTDTQATGHLATFKSELDNNALIRADYPDLVVPKTRGRGTVEADRVSLFHAKSGFVFAAAGMDSSNLGMKVGAQRPDLIILDDIEPHEGRYSADMAAKRLDTLLSAILPLNIYARVIIAGTVTMQGSIVHQIVKYGRGDRDDTNDWVGEQNITARHWPPIVTDDDGRRESIWPAKWPLEFLLGIEHTPGYAKNYANDPLGADGDYWTLTDIEAARALATVLGITRVAVSLDPAVTSKKRSDYSGIAVVGWSPSLNKCTVLEVRQVKKSGAALRLDVLDTVSRHNAGLVLVETNQGGDLWQTVLWGLPVKVKTVHQSESKEVRAASVLDHYQRGRVGHAEGADLRDYEGQLVAFPKAPHDDMVDAAGTLLAYFLNRASKRKVVVGGSSQSYT
jgi:predicted phage terminase large subunit-like protein